MSQSVLRDIGTTLKFVLLVEPTYSAGHVLTEQHALLVTLQLKPLILLQTYVLTLLPLLLVAVLLELLH